MKKQLITGLCLLFLLVGCGRQVSRGYAIPLIQRIYPEVRADAELACDPNALCGMDVAVNSGSVAGIQREWPTVCDCAIEGIDRAALPDSVKYEKIERVYRFNAVVEELK